MRSRSSILVPIIVFAGCARDVADVASSVSRLGPACSGIVLHQIRYDAWGRKASVERTGLGHVGYTYHPTSGLLIEKAIQGRTIDIAYDDKGRVTEMTATSSGGASRTISFAYDAPGQLGFLTSVT